MSDWIVSRRKFLKSAATTASALSLTGPALGTLGANDRIRVGLIGAGNRGLHHIHHCKNNKDVEILAICDVDQRHREKGAKRAGNNPKKFSDFRQVLDMKEIDAVFIAPPCHWHAIPAIMALQAGKDVYLEKPICHTIHEGQAIIQAAQKHKQVVQTGQQQRSHQHWTNAVKRIHAGELGTITTVSVWNAWNPKEMRRNIDRRRPDQDPPKGVDYDMWLGPAPKRPFNYNRFHFSFYFWWDYSGGMVSAWGPHLFDIVLWAMGKGPKSVCAASKLMVMNDGRDTPDTMEVAYDCDDYVMSYSMRHSNGFRRFGKMGHGIEFVGTEAVLQINRLGFQMYHDKDRDTGKPFYSEESVEEGFDYATALHHQNFFECMRTRQTPNAPLEVGHAAAVVPHLTNISSRVGRQIRWDPKKEIIIDDPEASKLLTKEYRGPWHLP